MRTGTFGRRVCAAKISHIYIQQEGYIIYGQQISVIHRKMRYNVQSRRALGTDDPKL
jgi:hypothetical protein